MERSNKESGTEEHEERVHTPTYLGLNIVQFQKVTQFRISSSRAVWPASEAASHLAIACLQNIESGFVISFQKSVAMF